MKQMLTKRLFNGSLSQSYTVLIITLKRYLYSTTKTGSVKVVAEYRIAELPPPYNVISERIINALKKVIQADSSQGG